jgi:hypothetical protein
MHQISGGKIHPSRRTSCRWQLLMPPLLELFVLPFVLSRPFVNFQG